jgi:hypothetical protein
LEAGSLEVRTNFPDPFFVTGALRARCKWVHDAQKHLKQLLT